MKLKNFWILVVSLILALNLQAQTVNDVFQLAEKQFELGNYDIASKEYNRAYYFAYQPRDILLFRIAQCYFQMGNYGLAAQFFDRTYQFSVNDSLKNEAVLEKAFCLLIQEQFVLCISELYNFKESRTAMQTANKHFLKGIAHWGLHEDPLAFDEFKLLLQNFSPSDSLVVLLNNEFDKVYRYPRRYHPNRAYIMSALLPGLGQFSSGAVKEGVNSMLLIGGLVFIAYRVVSLYSFLDAFIGLFPWIQRYYYGGMEHSKKLAIEKIEEKRYESYLRIIELLNPENRNSQ